MFEKMLSLICCCFPTTPSSTQYKQYTFEKSKTAFIISCPSSTPCHLSPIIIPCTSLTSDSSQIRFVDDSTITSIEESATMMTDISSASINSGRIAAIKELVETEQRYVNDLRIVANEFIKPLSNMRMLNDYEIEQLFGNWFNLIACNTVLLNNLQEQVQYKEAIKTISNDDDLSDRIPRSASLSNIGMIAQAPMKSIANSRHDSMSRELSPYVPSSPSCSQQHNRFKYRTGGIHRTRRCSPSPLNLRLERSMSTKHLDDNLVPQTSYLSSTMTINDHTRVGEILCSYLPYMADTYFHYCNCRSQANKNLQSKIDLNKQFRTHTKLFQNKTRGLSLNGYLTKPIQRVTRYPLLIEKILKNTPNDHPDYQAIQQAYECAREINERINKQICEQENISQLDWLQQHVIFGTDEYSADGYIFDELVKFNSPTKFHSHRQLLLHGLVVKVISGKELLAFLFNDFLLLTTIKSSSSSNNWQTQVFETKSNLQLKLYRSPIFLTDIITASETVNDKLTFSIATKTHHKPLVLKTPLSNIRTLWVRTINNAIEECQNLEKSIAIEKALVLMKEHEHKSELALARLNLVVQEAQILLSSSVTTNSRHRALYPYCEITIGSSTLKTAFFKRTNNPKWNESMQFLLYNLNDDIIQIKIFDHEYFSPDENLANAALPLTDLLLSPIDTLRNQPSYTFNKTIYINNGISIFIKCTIEFL